MNVFSANDWWVNCANCWPRKFEKKLISLHWPKTSIYLAFLLTHSKLTIFFLYLFLYSYFMSYPFNPGLFFVYFRSFQTNIITIFTTNICEKCPSSIWCRDSNPRPSERESLPITTRPGLPPFYIIIKPYKNTYLYHRLLYLCCTLRQPRYVYQLYLQA